MKLERQDTAPPQDHSSTSLRILDIRDLLADDKEIIILHDGERYRLRITANNKLLLTK